MEKSEKQEREEVPGAGTPPPPARTEKALSQEKLRRLPTLLRLTRRGTVFLSLTLIAAIIFYVAGNRQIFLDSSMSLILRIITSNAIALSLFSAAAVPQCVFYILRDKRLGLLLHLLLYVMLLIAGCAVSVISLAINLLSEGASF